MTRAPAATSASSRPTAGCARIAASSSARAISSPTSCREGMLHVALVPSPASGRAHRLDRQVGGAGDARRALRARPATSSPARPMPLMNGLDTPNVPRYPLAVGQSRAMPANGSWRWSPTRRALAEDAAEKVARRIRAAAFRASTPRRPDAGQPAGASRRTAPTCCSTAPSSGARSRSISPRARDTCRSASPGAAARPCRSRPSASPRSWDPWREMLDVWASIQMPKYPDQIARALRIPASIGARALRRRCRRQLRRQARHQADRAGRAIWRGGSAVPVRLIEDRLENMRGGDAHGPERIFDVEVAFDDDGIVTLDEDARARQCRRLCRPLAVPARQADRRHRRAVQDQERAVPARIAVITNKTVQEAVRGFGQSPTNYAIETRDRQGGAPRSASTASRCAAATSSARRSSPI